MWYSTFGSEKIYVRFREVGEMSKRGGIGVVMALEKIRRRGGWDE